MFLSEWREFPSAPCLAGKKMMRARVSMLLKSRNSLLVSFLVGVRTYRNRGTWKRLGHCAVYLHRSVPDLIIRSSYTHHVIISFRKTLWRCQTHSLKSIIHHNFFRCIKTCGIIYIDISASDEHFVFVLLCACAVSHLQEITLRVHFPVYFTKTEPVHIKRKIETLQLTIVGVGNIYKYIYRFGNAYSWSVFVTLCIQHERRMPRIIHVQSLASTVLSYFSTLSHKRYDFRKKISYWA